MSNVNSRPAERLVQASIEATYSPRSSNDLMEKRGELGSAC